MILLTLYKVNIEAEDDQMTGVVKPKVLVLEDEPSNSAYIVRALQLFNCDVTLVRTGPEALRTLHEQRFDFAYFDWSVPEMDGLELLRRVRDDERLGRLPVILVTAHAFEDHKRACLEAGATAYLSKPFTLEQLEKTLETVQCPAA